MNAMNFDQARFNMVEQQIRTWEVLDQGVLSLLSVVKREDFVPPAYRALAFVDTQVPLPNGQVREIVGGHKCAGSCSVRSWPVFLQRCSSSCL